MPIMTQYRPNIGSPLGVHRVLDQKPRLVQAAEVVDPSLPLYLNEVLLEVECLQIDSASFHQLSAQHKTDEDLAEAILHIVAKRGKMQNPITGSGGMLLGRVAEIGPQSQHMNVLQKGERVATLISLTATPLVIRRIKSIERAKERVHVEGHAILFDRSLFAKMPDDLPEGVALAALDVCGAPLLVKQGLKDGDVLCVLGLGKAGRSIVAMCDLDFADKVQVLGIDPSPSAVEFCKKNFRGTFVNLDATDPLSVMNWVQQNTKDGQGAEFVVNVTNVADTEISSILATKAKGQCLFFGMATDFQKATLGAEALAQDIWLRMGSGYTAGHADFMLNLLRRSDALQQDFLKKYK